MPIGVPRIIYCWGEELPAQWTDIYNFIFRRRMVFLMQYLDDELCNQICGLLINIHMEDRSKELEKKEMENSGLFKSSGSQKKPATNRFESPLSQGPTAFSSKKKERSIEDLMISEEDLGIDENSMLETHTLQKISLEWLNWNSQFFDYSEEPYLFYLAELLAKDMTGNNAGLMPQSFSERGMSDTELAKFMMMFKQMNTSDKNFAAFSKNQSSSGQNFDIYSPFRFLANKISQNPKDFLQMQNFEKKLEYFQKTQSKHFPSENNLSSLTSEVANKELLNFFDNSKNQKQFSEGARSMAQQFDVQKISADYLSIYQKALKKI